MWWSRRQRFVLSCIGRFCVHNVAVQMKLDWSQCKLWLKETCSKYEPKADPQSRPRKIPRCKFWQFWFAILSPVRKEDQPPWPVRGDQHCFRSGHFKQMISIISVETLQFARSDLWVKYHPILFWCRCVCQKVIFEFINVSKCKSAAEVFT